MRVMREVGGARVLHLLEQCSCLTDCYAERPDDHRHFSGPLSLRFRRVFRSEL